MAELHPKKRWHFHEPDHSGWDRQRPEIEVEPFPIRLGNVISGLGNWGLTLAVIAAVWLVAAGIYDGKQEAIGRAFSLVTLTMGLLYLPCRVLNYLITGRR